MNALSHLTNQSASRTGPSDPFAWIATVLSVLGLVIAMGGSSWGALLFLAAWGAVVLARADKCLRLVMRSPLLWLIPAVALLSVIWSIAPEVSLRAAVQLALTVSIASLSAAFLRPRDFVSAMSVSLLFGAIFSVLFGRYGTDGMTGERVFLGIFASKNTMALFMSFLVIFALAVVTDRGQALVLRMLAAMSFVLGVLLLLQARSVGAILTTVASLLVLFVVAGFARLHARARFMVLVTTAAFSLPCIALVATLAINGTLSHDISSFIVEDLGKDTTLTGRTVLWQIALTEIAKRPFVGTGYYAFWMQGNLLAEAIWRSFSIETRMGFHFHNTFLEFAVELGWLGLAALVVTMALAVERAVRHALWDRTQATAALLAAIFCLATRTPAEVDAPYPFALGTFLLFVVAAYGADYVAARRPTVAVPTPPMPSVAIA